jgi:predicted Zn-ribbon and HTH transcriptional regulator
MTMTVEEATQESDIGPVQLQGYRCRCGHEWLARNKDEHPSMCPKCKSRNWDKERLWERRDLRAS